MIGTGAARDGCDRGRQAGRRRLALALVASVASLAVATLFGTAWLPRAIAQERVRTIKVRGRRHVFEPATIEVSQDELVRIVFHAEDVAHSFTIDEYRIAKRAGAGRTVTFEFRADRAGRFTYYCNMKSDEGCRNMRGVLVVAPR
ncbi:MAG: cupredoxin domain-containing protein [Vicinamibacterales bacterium]|jgi:heme/copper-type cytochrome/quinol oxidase subunit 2|nr:cupredoxin domain-containing protein [Vicinamibacterales bacterium]